MRECLRGGFRGSREMLSPARPPAPDGNGALGVPYPDADLRSPIVSDCPLGGVHRRPTHTQRAVPVFVTRMPAQVGCVVMR